MTSIDLTASCISEDDVASAMPTPSKETSVDILPGIRVLGPEAATPKSAHGGSEVIIGKLTINHIKTTLQREWSHVQGDMSVIDKVVRVLQAVTPLPFIVEFKITSGPPPVVPKMVVSLPTYLQQGTTVSTDILQIPEIKSDGSSMAVQALSKIDKSVQKFDDLTRDWCLDAAVFKKAADPRNALDKKCIISLLTTSTVHGIIKRLNTDITPAEQPPEKGARRPVGKPTTKSLLFVHSEAQVPPKGSCKTDTFIVKAAESQVRSALKTHCANRTSELFKQEGVTYPKSLGAGQSQLAAAWSELFSLETVVTPKSTEEGKPPEPSSEARYKNTSDFVKKVKSHPQRDGLGLDGGEQPPKERRQPPVPFVSFQQTEFPITDIIEFNMRCLALGRDKQAFASTAPHLKPFLPNGNPVPSLQFLSSVAEYVLPNHINITDVVPETNMTSHIVKHYGPMKELTKGGFDFIWQKSDFGKYKLLAPKARPEVNKRFSLPRAGNSPTNSGSQATVDPKAVLTAAGVPQGTFQIGKKGSIFLKNEAVEGLEASVYGKRCAMMTIVQKFILTRASIIIKLGLQASPIQRCYRCYVARKRAHQKRVDVAIRNRMHSDDVQREAQHHDLAVLENEAFAELISKFKSPLPLLFRRTVIFAQKQELEGRLSIFDDELNELVRMSNTFEEQKSILTKVQLARWKARDNAFRDLYASFIDHEYGSRTRIGFDEETLRRAITKDFMKPIKKELKLRRQLHREAELLLMVKGKEQILSPSNTYTNRTYSGPSQSIGYSRMNGPYSAVRESPMSPPRYY
eukprot:TRINITY_DN31031_c0_g1_i1.p1 TRINITY_DN31031_c0_g1~~TRINITY_DN31031_c0_g1_i1.p1  ORF type:complete len:800 (+),score=123.47 TRINITY_DN31031_c0_g1_i1:27-2426(+)